MTFDKLKILSKVNSAPAAAVAAILMDALEVFATTKGQTRYVGNCLRYLDRSTCPLCLNGFAAYQPPPRTYRTKKPRKVRK
jgi:hypothetical protein